MNHKFSLRAQGAALALGTALLVSSAPALAFDTSWLSLSFAQPTGSALASDDIDVYLTLSLSASATESLRFDGPAGAPYGLPDLLPSGAWVGSSLVPFAVHEFAYLSNWYGCSATFSDGRCPDATTTYRFEWQTMAPTLSLNPGDSVTYLMGHFAPNGAAGAPAGTYALHYAALAVFYVGSDADGNPLWADVTLASTPGGAVFTRDVVAVVPEPASAALMLAGLALFGTAAARRARC